MDCSWLDAKKYADSVDLEEYPDDALNNIINLSNVDRESVLLKLKQFVSQYFRIIPKL